MNSTRYINRKNLRKAQRVTERKILQTILEPVKTKERDYRRRTNERGPNSKQDNRMGTREEREHGGSKY